MPGQIEARTVEDSRRSRVEAPVGIRAPLRVAHVILEYHPVLGGAQNQLRMLAPLLRAEGVDLTILTRQYPSLGANRPFERIEGVPVHRLPAPGNRATASLAFTGSALLKIRALQPDVIHAYSLFSPLTIAMTARRLFHRPVVVKVLRGGLEGDVARIRTRLSQQQRISAFQQNVDAFIVISEEIDEELAAIGIPEERRVFIPNGVDTGRFRPLPALEKAALRSRLGLGEGPVAVYTGRLVVEKNVDLLLTAWETIQALRPDAQLLILGSGEQEEALKKQAPPGVRFLGQVADVQVYLQAADLFVLPSATEGLSNSLLEAMAAGLPAVASRVGGTPDIITHGENGWLIPPGDGEALCDGLVALLEEPALRDKIGEAARVRVLQAYSLPSVAKRLRGLYEQAVSRQGGRPARTNSGDG